VERTSCQPPSSPPTKHSKTPTASTVPTVPTESFKQGSLCTPYQDLQLQAEELSGAIREPSSHGKSTRSLSVAAQLADLLIAAPYLVGAETCLVPSPEPRGPHSGLVSAWERAGTASGQHERNCSTVLYCLYVQY